MKELEKQTPIQQHEERQQEQQYRLLGDLNYKPGLTLYQYDPIERVLSKAVMLPAPKTEVVKLPVKMKPLPKGQLHNPEYLLTQHRVARKRTVANVQFKPGCDYFFALNNKNAIRKLQKMINKGLIVNR